MKIVFLYKLHKYFMLIATFFLIHISFNNKSEFFHEKIDSSNSTRDVESFPLRISLTIAHLESYPSSLSQFPELPCTTPVARSKYETGGSFEEKDPNDK